MTQSYVFSELECLRAPHSKKKNYNYYLMQRGVKSIIITPLSQEKLENNDQNFTH